MKNLPFLDRRKQNFFEKTMSPSRIIHQSSRRTDLINSQEDHKGHTHTRMRDQKLSFLRRIFPQNALNFWLGELLKISSMLILLGYDATDGIQRGREL